MAVAARYNIAPTQDVSCILAGDDDRRRWTQLRWGLVPSWSDDPAIGTRMINARSETIDEKRSFKSAFLKRRCLIPADGYFEWMTTPAGKQPYLIEPRGGGVIAMAGIWECNKKLGSDDRPLETFSVLTTAANEVTSAIHHRMPVLLDRDAQSTWLNPDVDDPKLLKTLLRPAPEALLHAFPVSRVVNSARNDVPECVQPIEPPPEPPKQPSLF